jgi:hypothetical protein
VRNRSGFSGATLNVVSAVKFIARFGDAVWNGIITASDIDTRETGAALRNAVAMGALEPGLFGIGGAFEDSGAQERVGRRPISSLGKDNNRVHHAKAAPNTLPTIPNTGLARDRIATRLNSISFPPSKTRANSYYLAAKPVF